MKHFRNNKHQSACCELLEVEYNFRSSNPQKSNNYLDCTKKYVLCIHRKRWTCNSQFTNLKKKKVYILLKKKNVLFQNFSSLNSCTDPVRKKKWSHQDHSWIIKMKIMIFVSHWSLYNYPILIQMVSSIYFPHIRSRKRYWILGNN